MKVYAIDIDGTICNNTYGHYEAAEPRAEYIAAVNKLYDEGNQIIYWTARGSTTNIDWRILTETQLQRWGCKYHVLKMGKMFYDVLLDDKAMTIEQYFQGDKS